MPRLASPACLVFLRSLITAIPPHVCWLPCPRGRWDLGPSPPGSPGPVSHGLPVGANSVSGSSLVSSPPGWGSSPFPPLGRVSALVALRCTLFPSDFSRARALFCITNSLSQENQSAHHQSQSTSTHGLLDLKTVTALCPCMQMRGSWAPASFSIRPRGASRRAEQRRRWGETRSGFCALGPHLSVVRSQAAVGVVPWEGIHVLLELRTRPGSTRLGCPR